MLVMRRRAGEGVSIGGEIEIEILEVGPTRVKLGIVAPADLAIVRKEVILTRSENVTAAQTAAPETIAWLSRQLAPQLSKVNRQPADVLAKGNRTGGTTGGGKKLEETRRSPDMSREDTSGIQ